MKKHTRIELGKLKIKIKSLAEEAKIIRFEEKFYPGNSFFRESLKQHRVYIVREEARHALLAYAFMRQIPYKKIEEKCHQKPLVRKIEANVVNFNRAGYKKHNPKYKEQQKELFEEIKNWLEL